MSQTTRLIGSQKLASGQSLLRRDGRAAGGYASLIAAATSLSWASETISKLNYGADNGTYNPIPPGNPKSEVHTGKLTGGVCVPC